MNVSILSEYILEIFCLSFHFLHAHCFSIIDFPELPPHSLNFSISFSKLLLQLRYFLLVLAFHILKLTLFLHPCIVQTFLSVSYISKLLVKLSLLLLSTLYQGTEILFGPLEFLCQFDLSLGKTLIVQFDLFELVLHDSALVNDLFSLQLSFLDLKWHTLILTVKLLNLLLKFLDLWLRRLYHIFHLRFQNWRLVRLLLSSLRKLAGCDWKIKMSHWELFGLLKLLLLGVHSFKIITIINQGY